MFVYSQAPNLVFCIIGLTGVFLIFAQVVCGQITNGPDQLTCHKMGLNHGQATLTDGGQVITYKCRNRYKLWGSESATCGPDGLWTSPPPRCVRVGCITILATEDMIIERVLDGAVLHFTCSSSQRKLEGPSSLWCNGNRWSSTPPKCVVKRPKRPRKYEQSCDFERGEMCTWHITGGVGWTLQHDEVYSGYFIQLDDYTESGAIATSADTGRLWSGPLTSAVGEVCITFWFRLSQNGGLRVLVGVQDETTKTVVARSNGTVACSTDSGNVWRRALAKVTATSDMQVGFEGWKSGQIDGVVALDDITIDNCVGRDGQQVLNATCPDADFPEEHSTTTQLVQPTSLQFTAESTAQPTLDIANSKITITGDSDINTSFLSTTEASSQSVSSATYRLTSMLDTNTNLPQTSPFDSSPRLQTSRLELSTQTSATGRAELTSRGLDDVDLSSLASALPHEELETATTDNVSSGDEFSLTKIITSGASDSIGQQDTEGTVAFSPGITNIDRGTSTEPTNSMDFLPTSSPAHDPHTVATKDKSSRSTSTLTETPTTETFMVEERLSSSVHVSTEQYTDYEYALASYANGTGNNSVYMHSTTPDTDQYEAIGTVLSDIMANPSTSEYSFKLTLTPKGDGGIGDFVSARSTSEIESDDTPHNKFFAIKALKASEMNEKQLAIDTPILRESGLLAGICATSAGTVTVICLIMWRMFRRRKCSMTLPPDGADGVVVGETVQMSPL